MPSVSIGLEKASNCDNESHPKSTSMNNIDNKKRKKHLIVGDEWDLAVTAVSGDGRLVSLPVFRVRRRLLQAVTRMNNSSNNNSNSLKSRWSNALSRLKDLIRVVFLYF